MAASTKRGNAGRSTTLVAFHCLATRSVRRLAGVERSESLDAGEHRITIATGGQIANLKPKALV